MPAENVQFCCF